MAYRLSPNLHTAARNACRIASGGFTLSPSKKYYAVANKFSQVLSEENIVEIIDRFVSAIERAKKAGFAGVQLHAAHGYLLSEFLSGGLNTRKTNGAVQPKTGSESSLKS